MTEPRDPQHHPPGPTQAASEDDLAASERLEGWLAAHPQRDGNPEPRRPAGRAEAMLEARNLLRSREDAASSDELDRLIEGALGELAEEPPPLPTASMGSDTLTGGTRGRTVHRQWIAAAAAALMLIVGAGTLVLLGTGSDEFAQVASDSASGTQPSQAKASVADPASGAATTSVVPESSQQPSSPELQAGSSPSADTDESTRHDGSGESSGAGGDTTVDQGPTQQRSVFAGVHATGRIPLP